VLCLRFPPNHADTPQGAEAADSVITAPEVRARYTEMVRRKTLSPCGSRDENDRYRNAHVSIHEDELTVAGMDIGEEVFVRVRDERIVVERADR
jgi:hypothetical protein